MIVDKLISFEYASLFVLLLLFVIYTGKKKAKLPIYKVYYWALLINMVVAVQDILINIFRTYTNVLTPQSLNFATVLYYVAFFAIGLVCNLYVLGLAGVNLKKDVLWRGLLLFPYAAELALSITSPLTGLLFYYDNDMIYQTGPLYWIVYACIVYDCIIWITLLFRFQKQLTKSQIAYLTSFVAVLSVFAFLQYVYAGEIVLTFPISLCLIVVVLGIQKSSDIFDNTNAMRFSFLIDDVKHDIESNYDFNLYFVKIHDCDNIYESFGENIVNESLMRVVFYLEQLIKGACVYRLDRNTFVLKSDYPEKEDIKKISGQINERFKQTWENSGFLIDFPVSVVYLSYPVNMQNKSDFYNIIDLVQNVSLDAGEVRCINEISYDKSDEKILEAIKKAIDNDSLQVYYQPIYSNVDKCITAAEALVRLFDDEMGYISPEKFIPIAEKNDLIFDIGRFVFKEVCKFYSEKELEDKGIKYIEVNLSGLQMMQYQMAEEYCDIMNGWRVSHDQINFEITETSALIRNKAVTQNIRCFIDKGIELSLDDFGTGYSNLSYLYNIPFSIIKIDKGILWDADKNEKADVVLSNTMNMSKKMKMRIVVEGIETEEHVKKVLSRGCDYLQGFYFSQPVPGDEFIDYINNFSLPKACI